MTITYKTLLSSPEELSHFKVYLPNGLINGGLLRTGDFGDATNGNFEYAGIPFFHDLGNVSLVVNNLVNAPTMTANLPTPMAVEKIHGLAFTAYSNTVSNNVIVGKLRAYYDDDSVDEVDLVAGLNISEWAYERPKTPYIMQHNEPMNLGYSWRTNVDAPEVYNGREYYISINTDSSKLLTKVQLFVLNEIMVGITVTGLTLELPKIKSSVVYVENTRPTSPPEGFSMYDTSISKFIIFDGTDWRDTLGNIV